MLGSVKTVPLGDKRLEAKLLVTGLALQSCQGAVHEPLRNKRSGKDAGLGGGSASNQRGRRRAACALDTSPL